MTSRLRSLTISLLALGVASCVSWEHPTKSASDFDRDLSECEIAAAPAATDGVLFGSIRNRCMRSRGWRA